MNILITEATTRKKKKSQSVLGTVTVGNEGITLYRITPQIWNTVITLNNSHI